VRKLASAQTDLQHLKRRLHVLFSQALAQQASRASGLVRK
jgi:hypothetical protein